MEIEHQLHLSHEIDSNAEIESLETYEDRIHFYKKRNYTYIPLIEDGAYYNTDEGWVKEIQDEQIISDETHLITVLEKLQEQPFLLADYLKDRNEYLSKSVVEEAEVPEEKYDADHPVESEDDKELVRVRFEVLEEYFPDRAQNVVEEYERSAEESPTDIEIYRYCIITVADVNRRPVKDMLYKVLSELSSSLSEKIENEYPESEAILQHLRPVTIGRWEKDQLQGLELHIAEHMNLIEMMKVIQVSDKDFVHECGFTSKSQVEELNSINDLRNRVMHANRSLIHTRKDIQNVLDTVDNAQAILSNM